MTYRFTRFGITYTVKLSSWIPRVMRADAVTLGRTIYVRDTTLDAGLHCHEFTHVTQFDAQPWTFYFKYLKESFKGYPKAPNYGTGNRYETEAYARQLRLYIVSQYSVVPPLQ